MASPSKPADSGEGASLSSRHRSLLARRLAYRPPLAEEPSQPGDAPARPATDDGRSAPDGAGPARDDSQPAPDDGPRVVDDGPRVVDEAPLSAGQERLWFLQRFDPADASFNIFVTERLRGALDIDALGRALDEIVSRHGTLRTRFRGEERPVQQVLAPAPVPVEHLDLSALPGDDREGRALDLVAERTNRPFDLAQAPPLRVSLLRLSAEEHVLCLVVHHIVADGWSLNVLYRELSTLYAAFRRDEPSPLPPLPRQYAEYVRAVQDDDGAGDLAYWKERLAGVPPLEPPADRPRPAERTTRGAVHVTRVPLEVAEAVEQVARKHRCTPFMTLLAAYQVLLSRHTGQTGFAVGSSVAGRGETDLEPAIGFFSSTLVLRADLDGDPTFSDLLRRVRKDTLGALTHQAVPFERLLLELRVPRDLGRTPLFQTMFIQQNQADAEHGRLSLPDLRVESFPPGFRYTKTDLSLDLTRDADGLFLAFTYNTDLFDAATIAGLARRYETVLRSVAADPAERVSRLAVMPADEYERVLRTWNATATPVPAATVPELFAAQARDTPHAVAVSDATRALTYAALAARSDRLAERLRAAGAARGSLVGVHLDRSAEMVVALLAVMKAGAAYVPLDPAFPPARVAYVLADCGATVVVTGEEPEERLPHGGFTSVLVRAGGDDERADDDDDEPDGDHDAWTGDGDGRVDGGRVDGGRVDGGRVDGGRVDGGRVDGWVGDSGRGGRVDAGHDVPGPDDLAYVMYTSGSTGSPKGVAVPHRALTNFLWGMRSLLDARPGQVWSAATSMAFDISALELYLPLVTGGRVAVVDGAAGIGGLTGEGAPGARSARPARVTHVQATPSGWRLVLAGGDFDGAAVTALTGGEALPGPLAEELRSKVARLVNVYGPTETTIWSTAWEVPPSTGEVGIGRPIANTTVYVVDAAMNLVPPGVPGELLIGGAGLAHGYLGKPSLTAERFVPDPFGPPGARLYRTGDRVRWRADGTLVFLGRFDDQMKVRGHRVEPAEVEACLLRHPRIGQAAVTVRDDTLVAYLVATPAGSGDAGPQDAGAGGPQGEEVRGEEVREHCARTLPAGMVPNLVVWLDALPLTPNGKVDRSALPEARPAAARTPGRALGDDPVSRAVHDIWCDVLRLDGAGPDENLFDLGGHSLTITRLAARVRRRLDVDLPLRVFYDTPTIAGVVAAISSRGT
ncbi:condensation domain-containing protein [Sphaerisporangium sp. NPDC005288]|uniref:condensation domain-containing protein n=1 Tax=Sphaerisporangium sp. NPDC005288 TaxID=3155114 RepID=UPI0033BA756C